MRCKNRFESSRVISNEGKRDKIDRMLKRVRKRKTERERQTENERQRVLGEAFFSFSFFKTNFDPCLMSNRSSSLKVRIFPFFKTHYVIRQCTVETSR